MVKEAHRAEPWLNSSYQIADHSTLPQEHSCFSGGTWDKSCLTSHSPREALIQDDTGHSALFAHLRKELSETEVRYKCAPKTAKTCSELHAKHHYQNQRIPEESGALFPHWPNSPSLSHSASDSHLQPQPALCPPRSQKSSFISANFGTWSLSYCSWCYNSTLLNCSWRKTQLVIKIRGNIEY